MCSPENLGAVLSPSQSWGIGVPAGVWLCVRGGGVASGGRGAAGVTEQRFWSEQLLDKPCVAGSHSASPASWALVSPKPLTPITDPGPQAGFLKGSSAIWWQAEAVPGTSELDRGSHKDSAFQDPTQWRSHTALDRPWAGGWHLGLNTLSLCILGSCPRRHSRTVS